MSEQVTAIFTAANWTAGQKDGWNGSFIWSDASVIGGIDPWGTPRVTVVGVRSPEEAAAWLVQHAIDLRLAPASEPEETPAHEAHEETGAEAVEVLADEQGHDSANAEDVGGPAFDGLGGNDDSGEGGSGSALLGEPSLDLGAEILDADYTDPTDPPPEDHPSGAFIFGDNLEQKRTAAIGLVVQAALERLPAAIDYLRMSELRNFTMGVSEGRWPDDPAKREELDTLEATERLRRAIEAIRDAKIETLLTATREEIEAFDPQADWP